MKSKKVFSKIVVFMLLASTFLFAACTLTATPEFTIKTTAAETAQTTVDWLFEKIVDGDFNIEPYSYEDVVENLIDHEVIDLEDAPDYYIEVGTMENIDAVNSISIGGLKYKKGEEFYFTLFNNKIILDKAFKKAGNKLFIAAPIVAFESVNSDKIKINNFTFNFNLNTAAEAFSTEPEVLGSGSNVVAPPDELDPDKYDYELTVSLGDSAFHISYEGISEDDVVLTKNVLGKNLKSYGVVKAEASGDGFIIFYYPFDWHRYDFYGDINSGKIEMDDYTNGRLEYTLYAPGKGIAKLIFKITPGEITQGE